jgi:acetylornithine deacetylase
MDAVARLKELISFPTVSRDSNSDVTDYLEQLLGELGFETERLDFQDGHDVSKSCIVARKGPAGTGLAWFAHSDVVSVDSWSHSASGPWEGTVSGNRMYGRGSCDMKGSLACMLTAVQQLDAPLKCPVFITVTADEEVGYGGAREVARRSRLYREMVASNCRAIVGEPTSLRVVHAHKGGRAMRVTACGKAAHSSTGKGINANEKMIPFLAELLKLHHEMESSATWRDDRFVPPTPTMNIGINDHNGTMNITSPGSECTLYFRPMPGQNADSIVQRIEQLAADLGLESMHFFGGDPLFTDPESPFIRELVDITECGESRTVSYGTDGAVFTELPRIAVLGPGDIAQAHTDDEWIALEQLQAGTVLYAKLIGRWCC